MTTGKAVPQDAELDRLVALGRAVIASESEAISALAPRLGADFARACRLILDCRGRVVVMGIGKSGHVAGKVAATLASTGTPAFFVHPGEAGHGDLGMIVGQDVVLALSNSGETDEIVALLPLLKRLGVSMIVIAGRPDSTLVQNADVYLDAGVREEACPLGLAPTSSTAAASAMGDALAIALLEARGFGAEDFARSHPSGSLGRRLLLRIDDIMHRDEEIPRVAPETPLFEALAEMSQKRLGVTTVASAEGRLLGIFTDGDLRRVFDAGTSVHDRRIEEIMTARCRTGHARLLAVEALRMMETHRINALPIVDEDRKLIGIVNLHDLLRAKVI